MNPTVPNVGTYVGEFNDNARNGLGTFTYPDGKKLSGEWKDNKLSGEEPHNSSK